MLSGGLLLVSLDESNALYRSGRTSVALQSLLLHTSDTSDNLEQTENLERPALCSATRNGDTLNFLEADFCVERDGLEIESSRPICRRVSM
jgi:hypothetical protein